MKHKILTSVILLMAIAIGAYAFSGVHNEKAILSKAENNVIGTASTAKITAQIKPRKAKSNIISAAEQTSLMNARPASPFSAPARISPSGATVYGFLAWNTSFYGNSDHGYEFREVITDGSATTTLWDTDLYLSLGFVNDGKLYAYGHDSDVSTIYSTYYASWDVATGERLSINYTDHYDYRNVVICGAYDSDSDKIYAYTYNQQGNGYMFRTSSLAGGMGGMTTLNTDISYEEMCLSLAYCPTDRTLYGVTTAGKFVKIDTTDGSITEVFNTRVSTDSFPTAMIYSPADNAFLWNVNYTNGVAAFYSIDLESKSCSKIADWVEEEQYTFFTCNDAAIDAEAPSIPTLKSINFAEGATEGTVVYTMPVTTHSGNVLEGELTYRVKADDVIVAEGSANAGEDVSVNLSLTDGVHSIKCSCAIGDKRGAETGTDIYVGNDVPLAPQNVKFDLSGIRWDAVTQGVNNGYIDASAVTYDIYINDEKVGTSKYPIYAYDFEKGKTIDAYTAKIYAIFDGRSSAPGISNTVVYGDPYTLPATFTPTERQSLIFDMVDVNEDGSTWKFDQATPCFYNFYNLYNDADDWLITPPIKFTSTEHIYEMSLDAAATAGQYTEAFEVYIGATPNPESMTKIFGRDDVTNTSFKTFSDIFTIDTAGVYYIAIRATSKAAQYILMVNNINIAQSSRTISVPNAVSSITSRAAAEGELSATITFVLPETDMKDNSLNKDEELTAIVSSSEETVSVSGKPGARVRANITTTQGNNTITIYAENSAGAGRVAETTVYTGVDTPAAVTGIRSSVSEDNMTIHLSWNAPVSGYNGGYINPDNLQYRICYYSDYVGWCVDTSIPALNKTEFDYTIDKGTPLGAYNIGIAAVNEAGMCPAVSSMYVVAGEPYKLPMTETFPGGMASCNPMLSWTPTDEYKGSSWFVDDPAKYTASAGYDKGCAIIGYGPSAGSKGRLSLAKFSTEGATNPVFTFDYYFRGIDSDILAYTYGMSEPVKIGSTTDGDADGWGTMSITLPEEFHNRPWVELYFDVTYPVAYTFMIVGQYEVNNVVANDVAVTSISGPSVISLGQTATFKATYKVIGYESVTYPGGTWKVYNNGKLIEEEGIVVPDVMVEPGTEDYTMFTLNPTVNHVGKLDVEFVLYNDDMNNANNSAKTRIEVLNDNTTVAVTDLRATDATDSSVSLEWTSLDLNYGDGTFEDCKPFEITPVLKPFKNVDGDGASLNYFSNWVCPNQSTPAGWTVWSASQINQIMSSYGVVGEYTAYEGDNFLIALCPMWDANLNAAPAADDWLISDEVKGGSEVSFQAQPITNVYGAETIEILASSTTDETSAFSVVASFKVGDPSQSDDQIVWKECKATLPDDARYFAIRYVSRDIMGIIIDDIRYSSLNEGIEVVGYDILRDGVVIAENVNTNTYIDTTITDPDASYTYNVVPVLNNGSRGSVSNDVTVCPSGVDTPTFDAGIYAVRGAIVVEGHAGERVFVHSADGKTIASAQQAEAKETIFVTPGIYIVKAGRQTAKVMVK